MENSDTSDGMGTDFVRESIYSPDTTRPTKRFTIVHPLSVFNGHDPSNSDECAFKLVENHIPLKTCPKVHHFGEKLLE